MTDSAWHGAVRIALLTTVALVIASCAATRQLSAGAPADSPTSSPSPAATPSPTPSASILPPSLKSYTNPKWLYSLQYPATWYDLPNSGAPDNDKYFSNQDVRAPLEMEPGGVWLAVGVNRRPGEPCGTSTGMIGPSDVVTSPITVDADKGTRYDSPIWMAVAVTHKSWCYEIHFITYSTETRDRYMSDMNAVVASFRFNR